jgi:ankyrin repeat protein
MVASHSDHLPLAKLLLDKGPIPTRRESVYMALHAAVLHGDVELVKAVRIPTSNC